MENTEKILLELRFHLRKPYNEATVLIDAFNQIIKEGGRCDISVSTKSPSGPGHVLQLNLYRCKNSYIATSLGARIIDKLTRRDFIDISKFNLASVYYPKVEFYLEHSSDNEHGPTISIKLFENSDEEKQEVINRQFKLLENII